VSHSSRFSGGRLPRFLVSLCFGFTLADIGGEQCVCAELGLDGSSRKDDIEMESQNESKSGHKPTPSSGARLAPPNSHASNANSQTFTTSARSLSKKRAGKKARQKAKVAKKVNAVTRRLLILGMSAIVVGIVCMIAAFVLALGNVRHGNKGATVVHEDDKESHSGASEAGWWAGILVMTLYMYYAWVPMTFETIKKTICCQN
jgi:hypothetical protein